MNKTTKFDELRFKTDNQLIRLVNHELDFGICCALEALRHLDDSAVAGHRYTAAQRACTNSQRLLRLAGEIPANDRIELESKLTHLRGLLALVSATPCEPIAACEPSEENISALAHTLWKARGCPEGLPEEDWFCAERVLKHVAA